MSKHYEVAAAYDSGEKVVFKDTDRNSARTVAREYAMMNTNSFFAEGAGVYECREGQTPSGVPVISRFILAWYDANGNDVTQEVIADMADRMTYY